MWYQSQYQRALRRAFPLLQEVEEKDRSEGFTGREWVAVVWPPPKTGRECH